LAGAGEESRRRGVQPLHAAAAPDATPPPSLPYLAGQPRDHYGVATCLLAPRVARHGAGATAGLRGGNVIFGLLVVTTDQASEAGPAAGCCCWWLLRAQEKSQWK